jgi:hypothetical protein
LVSAHFFFLPFFISSPLSFSIAVVTTSDLEFQPPSLLKLSVKLFPKVSSSSSPIYFKNAP